MKSEEASRSSSLSDTNETIICKAMTTNYFSALRLARAFFSRYSLAVWFLCDLLIRLSRNMRELSSLDSGVCCPEEPRDQVIKIFILTERSHEKKQDEVSS